MAESEDTTSLLGVTRRALLTSAATIPLAPILRGRPTDTAASPIAAVYRDWRKADAEVRHWCREWGKPESALVRSVGFPRVAISLPPSTTPTWVATHEDIDRTLVDSSDLETLRGSLHAELAARTARWDAEATAIGLAAADRQEALALERREELAFRTLRSLLVISRAFSRNSRWSCGWEQPRMATMRFLGHKSNPSSMIFAG